MARTSSLTPLIANRSSLVLETAKHFKAFKCSISPLLTALIVGIIASSVHCSTDKGRNGDVTVFN
jgi:hypothetical protein